MSPVARGRTSILAWGHVRTASPRAALWILALLVPSGYSVAAGEVGRALAVPQTQTTAAAGGDVTWDFETGDLRGWTSSGTAFAFQPTRGDSPRSRQSASNHQGEFWIGTYERYQGRRGETVGTIQGDRPQGTLESQAFEIPPGPLRFLIGGGSEFATRVELVVISEIDGENRVLHATGNDSDAMQRVTWDLTPFAGRRGRIRIVDASSGDWGHINVDDIRFASVTVPNVIGRDEAVARRVLEALGLTVGTVEPVESRVAEGRVLVQNPRGGARVEPGAPIDLGVAELERVTVPNLVGRGGTEVDRQGEFWIGTYERYQGRRGETVGTIQGDRPQGTLESQAFEIPPGPLRFLIGGGSEFATRVELVVISEIDGENRVLHATGNDSDAMQRVTWDLTPFAGRRGRIRIVDASSGDWGHINVDDIRFASVTVPNVIGRDEAVARRVLEALGLTVGTVEPVESRVAEGRVLVQNPRGGGAWSLAHRSTLASRSSSG